MTTTWTKHKITLLRHDISILWTVNIDSITSNNLSIGVNDSWLWLDRWQVECVVVRWRLSRFIPAHTLYVWDEISNWIYIFRLGVRILTVRLNMAYLRERKKSLSIIQGERGGVVQVGDPWSPRNRLQSEHKWWWPGIQFSSAYKIEEDPGYVCVCVCV